MEKTTKRKKKFSSAILLLQTVYNVVNHRLLPLSMCTDRQLGEEGRKRRLRREENRKRTKKNSLVNCGAVIFRTTCKETKKYHKKEVASPKRRKENHKTCLKKHQDKVYLWFLWLSCIAYKLFTRTISLGKLSLYIYKKRKL